MLKKYPFFILLFFLATVAKAEFIKNEMKLTPEDFSKDECVLIKEGQITKGSCLTNVFYSQQNINAVIQFNGIEYHADFFSCSDKTGYCRFNSLASENEQYTKNDDAKMSYRDANLKIGNQWQKYICLKRNKAAGHLYELCFKNVNYSGN